MPAWHWHILTGEYPPHPGGVSDYTRLVAEGLIAAGDRVEVWAPARGKILTPLEGGTVHALPDTLGWRSRRRIAKALVADPQARILVQYAPHAFGWKGLNAPFARWLSQQAHVCVMFHEVAFPIVSGQPWKHRCLAWTQRTMACWVAGGAEKIWVATPAWRPILAELLQREPNCEWSPVPSNIPTEVDPQAVAAVRASWGFPAGCQVIGHFGTYGAATRELLDRWAALLFGAPQRRLMLLGRGSREHAQRWQTELPAIAAITQSLDDSSAVDLAHAIAACDLLIQPFIDGATTRRTSLISGMALGKAIVTTSGPLTESLWQAEQAVGLAAIGDTESVRRQVDRLLEDNVARREMEQRARDWYARFFDLSQTIARLRSLRSADPDPAQDRPAFASSR